MRAEPPVHRLSAVGRRRGPRLPADETAPLGWLPTPEEDPPDRGAFGPGVPVDGAVAHPVDDVARQGGVGGLTAVVREGVADRLPARWRAGGRPVPPRAALAAIAVALALVLGLVAHRMASGTTSQTIGDPAAVSGQPQSSATGGTGTVAGSAGAAPNVVGASPGSGPARGTTGVSGAVGAADAGGAGGGPVVDVEGKVRRPGLVRLDPGARVADAVEAAGGPAPGAALIRINLARPLGDGEQVVVPGPDDPLPAAAQGPGGGTGGGGSGSGSGSPGAAVDLNTSSEAQLDVLPGVGPVLAGRIVAWRTEHGRFTSVDQLSDVSGIGEVLLAKLRPLVRV